MAFMCPALRMPSLRGFVVFYPRGSIYTTIMELDPKSHNGDGLLGPNSIVVVYVDPLGIQGNLWTGSARASVICASRLRGVRVSDFLIWEFPKIGDPNMVPK